MIVHPIHISEDVKTLIVSSEAFKDRTYIPAKYTCDGENINPPLKVNAVPYKTKSLVLIVEDPDAPAGTWIHWLVWNIPPSGVIDEKSIPGIEGMNDFRKRHYGGPCPPSGTHRYFFKVYALDAMIELHSTATFMDLELAITPHIIGFGELIGLYKRD